MRRLIIVILIIRVSPAFAQDSTYMNGGLAYSPSSSNRKLLSRFMIGTVVTGSLIESYYAWWKNAEKPFSFYNSGWFEGSKGIDRIGHFCGAYYFFHLSRDVMLYGGHDEYTADLWGLGLSAFHSLSIEIGDGFSPWGFDLKDLASDIAGIGYAYMQTKIPALENINFKYSYWSHGLKSAANFSQDYDALTIWMAFNVHGFLPDSWKNYWPKFLGLAVGYGVDDHGTRSELAVALDVNLGVFKINQDELALLQKAANRMHLPLPGMKFTEVKVPRYDLFLLR